jgi:tartrate dehydratase alpha subunit/fumarate hydratase class I-like protein
LTGIHQHILQIEPEALRLLTAQAMTDIAHLLRPAHLQQLSNILKDGEATANDKFVALELLKNANIASNFVLPGCQDTGAPLAACWLRSGLFPTFPQELPSLRGNGDNSY